MPTCLNRSLKGSIEKRGLMNPSWIFFVGRWWNSQQKNVWVKSLSKSKMWNPGVLSSIQAEAFGYLMPQENLRTFGRFRVCLAKGAHCDRWIPASRSQPLPGSTATSPSPRAEARAEVGSGRRRRWVFGFGIWSPHDARDGGFFVLFFAFL